jgi:hypothetical protein
MYCILYDYSLYFILFVNIDKFTDIYINVYINLFITGNFGDEVQHLYERSLLCNIKESGLDGKGTAMANTVLGQFHYEKSETLPPGNATKKQLRSAHKYYSESGRINLKV